jgi:hypothetical protein
MSAIPERIATLYDRLAANCIAFIKFAAIRITNPAQLLNSTFDCGEASKKSAPATCEFEPRSTSYTGDQVGHAWDDSSHPVSRAAPKFSREEDKLSVGALSARGATMAEKLGYIDVDEEVRPHLHDVRLESSCPECGILVDWEGGALSN